MSPLSSALLKNLIVACLGFSLLAGCASHSSGPPLPGLPDRVELTSVPFFRGTEFQGSSMALASLLRAQGVRISPGLLEPTMHLPKDIDGLPINVPNAAREFGLVVYPLEPTLNSLLTQVAAGNPVLLRYEAGHFWGSPRYALLVGYDRYKQQVLLRSGEERRQMLGFSTFASAWKSAGSWAVLVQQPNQLPAQVDHQRWLQSANALAQAGQEDAAAVAVKTLAQKP
ncbi:peptidase C39 family protein [Pseudomonas sp. dw_358]|uniref:peptidase C39 family protein n=1 Tax=Pseudomonas sp. dw_358 TaxID=2720083 RepID=UPI001BD5E726|nr:peptidase C39 family protein [Pseudomonas sp. dw_358]